MTAALCLGLPSPDCDIKVLDVPTRQLVALGSLTRQGGARLAAACGAIRKDAHSVAVQSRLHQL